MADPEFECRIRRAQATLHLLLARTAMLRADMTSSLAKNHELVEVFSDASNHTPGAGSEAEGTGSSNSTQVEAIDGSDTLDERYNKYLRLLKIGVSLRQLEPQIRADGLEPSRLASLRL